MTTLIVTIDTEEEGLWGGRYKRTGNTVENIKGAERFQNLCDRYDVRPTYLADGPVVQDDASVRLLRGIQDDGRCEIGAHLHPWCNPPLLEEITPHNTYMCNLPVSLQRQKLEWLTDEIEERFGRRPTSFRAGRYGLDGAGAKLLAELDYRVDSSVIPFTSYASQGGPDFDSAPYEPYFVGDEDICTPVERGPLLEVPVSIGYSRKNFKNAHWLRQMAMHRWLRPFHAVGVVDRLGLARRVKFSPEQARASHLRQLVDAYVANDASIMVMMFHSSSLVVGHSPYVRTDAQLDRFHDRLESVFQYCLREHRMRSATLDDYARRYRKVEAT